MELLPYIKSLKPDERADFARRCGTSAKHLLNIAYGYKEASAHLAMAIEEESGRAVAAEVVAPSARWHVVRDRAAPLAKPPEAA